MEHQLYLALAYAEQQYKKWLRELNATPVTSWQWDDLRAMVDLLEGEALEAGASELTIEQWNAEVQS